MGSRKISEVRIKLEKILKEKLFFKFLLLTGFFKDIQFQNGVPHIWSQQW
jgi:hypothetical protein